jgi:hypothetical protein
VAKFSLSTIISLFASLNKERMDKAVSVFEISFVSSSSSNSGLTKSWIKNIPFLVVVSLGFLVSTS